MDIICLPRTLFDLLMALLIISFSTFVAFSIMFFVFRYSKKEVDKSYDDTDSHPNYPQNVNIFPSTNDNQNCTESQRASQTNSNAISHCSQKKLGFENFKGGGSMDVEVWNVDGKIYYHVPFQIGDLKFKLILSSYQVKKIKKAKSFEKLHVLIKREKE